MSDGSDIEMQTALPKKIMKKTPKSPSEDMLKGNEEPKKPSTKIMLHQALTDLKSKKGTSLYAIKKYIHEKFCVDVNKINYILKKLIKAEVEAGTIVQTKGIGASGSFRLVIGKEKVQKKKTVVEKLVAKSTKSEKKPKKGKDTQENSEAKSQEKKIKKKDSGITKKSSSKVKPKKKSEEENITDDLKEKNKSKGSKAKKVKAVQTPAKKRAAMLKRKSIGSIIKPPKMRPKAKA